MRKKITELKKEMIAPNNILNLAKQYKIYLDTNKSCSIECKNCKKQDLELVIGKEYKRWEETNEKCQVNNKGIIDHEKNKEITKNDKRLKFLDDLMNKPQNYPNCVVTLNINFKVDGNDRFPILFWTNTNINSVYIDIYRGDNKEYEDFYKKFKEYYDKIFYLNLKNNPSDKESQKKETALLFKYSFDTINFRKLPNKKDIINSYLELLKDDFEDPEITISSRTNWLSKVSLILTYSYNVYKETFNSISNGKKNLFVDNWQEWKI